MKRFPSSLCSSSSCPILSSFPCEAADQPKAGKLSFQPVRPSSAAASHKSGAGSPTRGSEDGLRAATGCAAGKKRQGQCEPTQPAGKTQRRCAACRCTLVLPTVISLSARTARALLTLACGFRSEQPSPSSPLSTGLPLPRPGSFSYRVGAHLPLLFPSTPSGPHPPRCAMPRQRVFLPKKMFRFPCRHGSDADGSPRVRMCDQGGQSGRMAPALGLEGSELGCKLALSPTGSAP